MSKTLVTVVAHGKIRIKLGRQKNEKTKTNYLLRWSMCSSLKNGSNLMVENLIRLDGSIKEYYYLSSLSPSLIVIAVKARERKMHSTLNSLINGHAHLALASKTFALKIVDVGSDTSGNPFIEKILQN